MRFSPPAPPSRKEPGCRETTGIVEESTWQEANSSLSQASFRGRLPAILCALVLLACALATHPVAELGISDDWSYFRTAQILARTGHVVYNGWATAILGWHLFLGAAFLKVWGYSFTVARASTLVEALATAFLAQRTMVRAGINSWNACIGTLTLVLSPLCLPLALSFMTDLAGLFCLVSCTYGCLRALQAETDRAMLGWLAITALCGVVLGSARQIAYLGVLVMFPCVVWLLRRRRHAVLAGAFLYFASVALVFVSIRWFLEQPYSVPESAVPIWIGFHGLYLMGVRALSFVFSGAFFLLPILAGFVTAVSIRDRRDADFLCVAGALCIVLGFLMAIFDPTNFGSLIAPFGGDWVTVRGLVDCAPLQGLRPLVLTSPIRILLAGLVLTGILCLLAFLSNSPRPVQSTKTAERVPLNHLLLLLIPYILVYLGLLMPRSSLGFLFDRYLLPLLFAFILLLLRLFQDRVRPNLPIASVALTAVFAVCAVGGTHDAFSLYRAKAAAIGELRSAGVRDTSIDGGFEHNGMTQIETFGTMNDIRIQVPARIAVPYSSPFPAGCKPYLDFETPAVTPGYTLSFDPMACGGPSGFSPAAYYNWVGFRLSAIYIVRTLKPPAIAR